MDDTELFEVTHTQAIVCSDVVLYGTDWASQMLKRHAMVKSSSNPTKDHQSLFIVHLRRAPGYTRVDLQLEAVGASSGR